MSAERDQPLPRFSWGFQFGVALLVGHIVLRFLLGAYFPLFYDEAYFWEWSLFPSLGYLDHPPMVAWVIRAFSWALDDPSQIAIRCGAQLFSLGTLLLIYRLAFQLFGDGTVALRSLVLALSLPVLFAVGMIMLPDGPLLFFHLLALCLFVRGLRDGRASSWCLTGLALGLALLSKLVAMLSIVGFVLFLIISPEHRFWLKRKEPYLALLLAVLVFSPFLYWNSTHDWATFRLNLWNRHVGRLGISPLKTGEFLFEQLANTSVFLAVPILGCLWVRSRALSEPQRSWYRLLRCHSLTVLVFFLVIGSITETHPQWLALAYPTATVALAVLWTDRPRHVLTSGMRWLVALSQATLALAACLALVGLPLLSRLDLEGFGGALGRGLAKGRVRLFGWPDLLRQIDPFLREASPDGDALLFALGHERATMLSFHRGGRPVINLSAYLAGGRSVGGGQWYYIPVESLNGRSGILVTDASWITTDYLRRFFEEADELATIAQRDGTRVIARHRVFRVVRLSAEAIRGGGHRRGARASRPAKR